MSGNFSPSFLVEDDQSLAEVRCIALTNLGYPPGSDGERRLRLTRIAKGLALLDNGPGFPPGFDPHRTRTFGWQLIVNLAMQLDGAFALEAGPGAHVTRSFPLTPPSPP